MNNRNNALKIIEKWIIPIILITVPIINFNQGVDYIDSMYSPGNFVFFNQMEGTWVVATFLSNVIGHLLTLLPGGGSYIGLRIYTGLFIGATSLISYAFLKKRINWCVVALGEVIAICLCWCPTTILYNYLTYFFMTLGLICLYVGLSEEKKSFLILAGIALGINLFVRFPNITQVGFILAVWVYGALKKKKFIKVLQETLWCMLGYFASVALCMGIIILLYGTDSYVSMITSLFAMTGDNTSYQPVQMVMAMLRELCQGLKWPLILALPTIVLTVVFRFVKEKYVNVLRIVTVLIVALTMLLCMKFDMFSRDYDTYQSFVGLSVTFVIMGIICCLGAIFHKGVDVNKKLAYGLVLLCMAITPLGSNNALFPIYNNLFLIAPVVLGAIWSIINRLKKNKMAFPMTAMMVGFVVVLTIQSVGFHSTFSFRGQKYGEVRDSVILDNRILYGCKTDKERFDDINELTSYWDNNKTDKILLLGNIPGVSYFLDAPCAISSSWPDLGSYSYDVYALQMKELERRIDELSEEAPTIIVNYGVYSVIEDDAEAQDYFLENSGDGEGYLDLMLVDPKIEDLKKFIQKYGYSIQLCNKHFVVYYLN